jgi:hypothetical protein
MLCQDANGLLSDGANWPLVEPNAPHMQIHRGTCHFQRCRGPTLERSKQPDVPKQEDYSREKARPDAPANPSPLGHTQHPVHCALQPRGRRIKIVVYRLRQRGGASNLVADLEGKLRENPSATIHDESSENTRPSASGPCCLAQTPANRSGSRAPIAPHRCTGLSGSCTARSAPRRLPRPRRRAHWHRGMRRMRRRAAEGSSPREVALRTRSRWVASSATGSAAARRRSHRRGAGARLGRS